MNVLREVRCKDEKLKDGSHGNILQKLSGEGILHAKGLTTE